jgi:hypothetical protein
VAYPAGKLGAQAIQFDGSSGQYVTVPLCVSNDFTIAFWVKTTATGGSGQWYDGKGLVDGEMPGPVNDFGVTLVGNNAAFGVGNPDTTIYSTSAINDGNWHHVTATRNAGTGEMDLYVDGNLQASAGGPTGTRAAPTDLRIGAVQTLVSGSFLAGTMDDVQLFDRVFSAAEVPGLMNHAPQLAYVFDASTAAGVTLHIANSSTDADEPAQSLTYRLPVAPDGASINPLSGLIMWRPTVAQADATYRFNVSVTDNGSPSLSATQRFNVTVAPVAKPQLSSYTYQNSSFQLQVNGDAGPDYIVQASTNLADAGGWFSIFTNHSPALPFVWSDNVASNYLTRFYRILLAP